MNIDLLQKNLKEGLSIVGRASSKSSNLPILKNILMDSRNGFLGLSATDLEIGIKWWTLVKVEKEGGIAIPYNSLSSFINFLPNDKINLKEENSNLFIDCKEYKTQIRGVSVDDFPEIPSFSKEKSFIVNSNVLCDSLSQIIDIPSMSKVKPEISGILFSFNEDELKIVATDSYRLAEKKVKVKKEEDGDFSFIIPQRTAREIINIFKEEEKDITVIFGENQILFKVIMDDFDHSKIELTSKIIEGNYPNYESIIPGEYKTQVIINREDFLNKVKAGSVFASKINEVNLHISPEKGEVYLKSGNNDLGNYEAKIEGKSEGEEVKISFNYRFLLDGLTNMKSSEVIFEASNESAPGVLKPVGKSDYIYVVMPIKN